MKAKRLNQAPIRRTQGERRQLSHSRMLEAAAELIARQGSSRTTLSQIGETSGYTHGLVSHRFGSKGKLIATLVRQLQRQFAQSLLPVLGEKRGIDALKLTCEKYLRAATSVERMALYVLIGEALGPVPEIKSDLADADDYFRKSIQHRIEEGIRSGEIRRRVDPLAQAAMLVGTLRGLVIENLLRPGAFDLEAVCRELNRNLELTLATKGKRA
ncbi:MAG: TetR/AcrR family transcriptional regulator [Candidatus Binataceae bacterium]